MKLTINREKLLKEVNNANKIIDQKSINPELLGIFIEVDNDSITFLSSNGPMNWKSKITKEIDPNFEVEQVGKILVKGRFLIEILRKIDEDLIELSMIEKNELIIKTDRVRFSLQILDANEYPLIGFRESGVCLNINPNELRKAINQTMISIDEFNKKIIFTGMNFQISKNESQMKIFTTDSYRISTKKVSLEKPIDEDLEFTISYRTLSELIRLLDGVKDLRFYIFDGYVTFVIDNLALFQTTLIEGKYPNVERAFPTSFATTLTINRNYFIKALSRANLTSEEGMTPIVTLTIKKDSITLSSNTPDVGNYNEKLTNFDFEGEEQHISFNIKYLLEAFRSFDDDSVFVKLISAIKPLEIGNTKTDKSLRQLILPLSIG